MQMIYCDDTDKNKYWIGGKYAFLKFCQTDLKSFWTEMYSHQHPAYTYTWDRAFKRCILDDVKIKEYIADITLFFGDYFPEIFEDISKYDAR